MRCAQCGHNMEQIEGTYRYNESGLKNVLLINVPIHKCTSCKETEVEIQCMEELHLLLAFLIIFQPRPLEGDEVRFLRKHIGYSQEEFASKLGVSRITITRWESGKTIRKDQDKHMRRFYLEKMGQDLQKLPEIRRMLSVIVDTLPENKRERRIRTEDWIPESACIST